MKLVTNDSFEAINQVLDKERTPEVRGSSTARGYRTRSTESQQGGTYNSKEVKHVRPSVGPTSYARIGFSTAVKY